MGSRPYVLALDLGTSSLKGVAFDLTGELLTTASASYPTRRPAPLAAEQDPGDWWTATRAVVAALRTAPVLAKARLLAIGLCGQMHGVVLRDAAERVVRPCLTWADERGGERLSDMGARVDPARVLSISGNPLNAGFSAAKLDWLRAGEPATWGAVRSIALPKDELRLRLTGEIATEPTDASGTLLFDLAGRRWSSELLEGWSIDESLMPPVLDSGTVAGVVRPAAADELGLEPGIAVTTGAGDTLAAAAGLGIAHWDGGAASGVGMLGIGTAAQVLVTAGAPIIDQQGRLNALCHVHPKAWCAMAAVLDGGGALAWIRSVTGTTDLDFDAFLAQAGRIPPGADGVTFLPHLSGERTPGMNAAARASFVGLSIRHDRAHLVRAVLEGVAYSLREGLDVLREAGIAPAELRIGGTVSGSEIWLRILADVLGVVVQTTSVEQASARGAGLLAAAALDPTAPSRWAETLSAGSRSLEPEPAEQRAYEERYLGYRRVREALGVRALMPWT
jgi:xylulokinase